MSTCIHDNRPEWESNPYPFKSVKKDPGSIIVNDLSVMPSNPAVGSLIFNTNSNQMLMWDGNKWLPIDSAGPNEEVLNEWELLTEDKGFLGVRIFEDVEDNEGKRRIIVSDSDGNIIEQGLENVLKYIKNNTNEKQYLWAEARIFEYFS